MTYLQSQHYELPGTKARAQKNTLTTYISLNLDPPYWYQHHTQVPAKEERKKLQERMNKEAIEKKKNEEDKRHLKKKG